MYLMEPRPSSHMRACHVTDFSNGGLFISNFFTGDGKSSIHWTKVETYLLFCHFNTILKLFTVGPEHK